MKGNILMNPRVSRSKYASTTCLRKLSLSEYNSFIEKNKQYC